MAFSHQELFSLGNYAAIGGTQSQDSIRDTITITLYPEPYIRCEEGNGQGGDGGWYTLWSGPLAWRSGTFVRRGRGGEHEAPVPLVREALQRYLASGAPIDRLSPTLREAIRDGVLGSDFELAYRACSERDRHAITPYAAARLMELASGDSRFVARMALRAISELLGDRQTRAAEVVRQDLSKYAARFLSAAIRTPEDAERRRLAISLLRKIPPDGFALKQAARKIEEAVRDPLLCDSLLVDLAELPGFADAAESLLHDTITNDVPYRQRAAAGILASLRVATPAAWRLLERGLQSDSARIRTVARQSLVQVPFSRDARAWDLLHEYPEN